MTTVVQEHELPEAIRHVRAASEADYFDVFTLRTSHAAQVSPEEWARAGVDHAAGAAGQFVWRGILGLRLADRASPDRIAGWKIAERGDDWLRLEASSWCLTAHIVVHVGEGQVTIATCLHYDRPPARLIWPRLAIAHRAAMPRLMRGAERRIAKQSAR